jgi:hypothetical protein
MYPSRIKVLRPYQRAETDRIMEKIRKKPRRFRLRKGKA